MLVLGCGSLLSSYVSAGASNHKNRLAALLEVLRSDDAPRVLALWDGAPTVDPRDASLFRGLVCAAVAVCPQPLPNPMPSPDHIAGSTVPTLHDCCLHNSLTRLTYWPSSLFEAGILDSNWCWQASARSRHGCSKSSQHSVLLFQEAWNRHGFDLDAHWDFPALVSVLSALLLATSHWKSATKYQDALLVQASACLAALPCALLVLLAPAYTRTPATPQKSRVDKRRCCLRCSALSCLYL